MDPNIKSSIRYIGLGWAIAADLLVFVLGGAWLDSKNQSTPLYIIVGMILAMASIMLMLFTIKKTIQEDSSKGVRNEGRNTHGRG